MPDTRDHDDLFEKGLITKEEWHRREFYPPQLPNVQGDVDSDRKASETRDDQGSGTGSQTREIIDWYPTGPTANPCDIFNERHRRLHQLSALNLIRGQEPECFPAAMAEAGATVTGEKVQIEEVVTEPQPDDHLPETQYHDADPEVETTNPSTINVRQHVHCEIHPYDFALVCPLPNQDGRLCGEGPFS